MPDLFPVPPNAFGGLDGNKGGNSFNWGQVLNDAWRRGDAQPSPWICTHGVKKIQALLCLTLELYKSRVLEVADSQSHRALGFRGCP